MPTWSCEATFLPSKFPYQILDKELGERQVKSINSQLFGTAIVGNILPMLAKLDPQYGLLRPSGCPSSYTIEVVPTLGYHFNTDWLEAYDPLTKSYTENTLDYVFRVLKNNGFVPTVVTSRMGREKHYPTGGCHIHYDIGDFFPMSVDWYKNMERFHRNILIDYANRPYIRWLFANWFADSHSHAIFTHKDLMAKEKWSDDEIFKRGVERTSAIESRFMFTSKKSYLTFEFRFPSMVETPREVILLVQFIEAWVKRVLKSVDDGETFTQTISTRNFISWKKIGIARDDCKRFLVDILGLDWQDYETFFNRNLYRRIRFGKLV